MSKENDTLQFEDADQNDCVRAKTENMVLFCHVFYCPFAGYEPRAKFIEITPKTVHISDNFKLSLNSKKLHKILNVAEASGKWKNTAKLYDRSKIKSLRVVVEETYPKEGQTFYKTHAHHVVMDYGNSTVRLNYDFKESWLGLSQNHVWSYWDAETAGDMHRNLVHAMNVLMPAQIPHAEGGVLPVAENEPDGEKSKPEKGVF